MQFNITVNYPQWELTFAVKSAIYRDVIVYQIDSEGLYALIYHQGEHWSANDEVVIAPVLLKQIGIAIEEQVARHQLTL